MTPSGSVEAGFVEPQTGGPFTNASLTGTFAFGTTNQADQNVSDSSGVATFNSGTATVAGTSDSATIGSTPATPTLSSRQSFSNTYSVTNGMGTPGRGTITGSGANLVFYIVSPSKIILVDASTTNVYPSIQVAEK